MLINPHDAEFTEVKSPRQLHTPPQSTAAKQRGVQGMYRERMPWGHPPQNRALWAWHQGVLINPHDAEFTQGKSPTQPIGYSREVLY